MYSVLFFHAHPDTTNECMGGVEYNTKEEALKAYNASPEGYWNNTPYIMIDGPDINEFRKNPDYKRDDSWIKEQAMQAGMMYGCLGYNDYHQ